jgi:hypothetical protein
MAMGENPKRVYGAKGVTPMSRMGSAWEMRQMFEKATILRQKQAHPVILHLWWRLSEWGIFAQAQWCACDGTSPMPRDVSLEPLVALLRGNARLNVHCYEVHLLRRERERERESRLDISLECWR